MAALYPVCSVPGADVYNIGEGVIGEELSYSYSHLPDDGGGGYMKPGKRLSTVLMATRVGQFCLTLAVPVDWTRYLKKITREFPQFQLQASHPECAFLC